jgi:diguanylate cyclase
MSQDLIALGLRRPPGSAAEAVATALPKPAPDSATAKLLDASLALVRDLLAADEDEKRAALAERVDACRAALADGATAQDLTELTSGCVADGQQVVADLLAQREERAREMAAIVTMVRDVIGSVGSEINTLHSSLQKSTDRFDAIGHMTDTRQIKARLVAEVMTLKQLTVSRQKAWQDTARGLGERIHALAGQLVATRNEALTDPLTGIANRRAFERSCEDWIRTPRGSFVLALIDVDEFKQVNDTHGHGVGDRVLVFIAQTLARSLRAEDIVARIGGDEFAVMARGLTLDQAERRLRSVIASLKDPAAANRPLAVPAVSCGIAELSANDTADSLFERGDAALYAAKRQGKNRIVVLMKGSNRGR